MIIPEKTKKRNYKQEKSLTSLRWFFSNTNWTNSEKKASHNYFGRRALPAVPPGPAPRPPSARGLLRRPGGLGEADDGRDAGHRAGEHLAAAVDYHLRLGVRVRKIGKLSKI